MKKIKYFVLAFAAVCLTVGLASCEKEKEVEKIVEKPVEVIKEVEVPVEVPQDNNWSRYQSIVTADVLSQKKHDKAILLVAFGSTWDQAYKAFDTTIDAYKAAFGDYDVFLSYSSAICINRAAAGENTDPRFYYAPPFWLNAFAAEGVQYDEIVVQSLQVIPGEEYTRVINYIKDFANNANGDLDDDYLANVTLKPIRRKKALLPSWVMVTPTLTTLTRLMCVIPSWSRLCRSTARVTMWALLT